jgi:hypothetical protein
MKLLFYIIGFYSCIGFLYTQEEQDGQVFNTPPTNLNCFGAFNLCGNHNIVQKVSSKEENRPCNLGRTTLYYFFKSSSDGLSSVGNISTSSESSYRVYGPFDEFQDGCDRINSLSLNTDHSEPQNSYEVQANAQQDKYYLVEVTIYNCDFSLNFNINERNLNCQREIGCENCIPQFNPGKGKYIVSAWAKQEDVLPSITSYDFPHVRFTFPSSSLTFDFYPSGQIIDGWQRIEGTFEVNSGDMILELLCDGGTCYFDDIRIFPYDGSMISYVYDPITLRLVAELDERNYAKIYEYDEEGKLIRVKKETEKGIMTIQENRENSVKQ